MAPVPEIAELEQRLGRLRTEIDWPATPDLVAQVTKRVVAAPVIAMRRPWFESRWAIAAAVLLLAMAALIAYTPSRDAIANWINLHTIITRVNAVPTPSPLPSGPLGKRLGLGDPTTLADAESKVSWHIAVPASLGSPDEVYLQLPPDGAPQGEVSFVYKSRPGINTSGQTGVAVLITEANGQVNTNFFGKMLGPDATLENVTVKGHAGYWISGKPHAFFFADANGNFREDTLRLATNTLIFENNGIIVRIEGDLTKDQAMAIAASMA
jgi:hypothetical protein